jgi:toxin ParE1/3/4
MDVVFSSGALREVKEAAAYYEAEVEGLGRAFLGKLRDGISEIKEFPHASRIIQGDFRRHLLSRFPHGIIYQMQGKTIFIAAVMHLKRKPGYWDNR